MVDSTGLQLVITVRKIKIHLRSIIFKKDVIISALLFCPVSQCKKIGLNSAFSKKKNKQENLLREGQKL